MLAATAAIAIVLSAVALNAWRDVVEVGTARAESGLAGAGARPVDMKRLRRLMEQGRLSDREAMFCSPASPR